MPDSLLISVEGKGPTSRILSMLEACRCPCPKPHRLSFALSNLPEGTVITMPATTGTPITVSFPAPDAGSPLLKFTFHVIDTLSVPGQPDTTVTPSGLSASSDNPLLVPTLNADASSFDIAVNDPGNVSGTVTITDSFGDTLVVSVSQTVGTPPVETHTLSGFADTPVSQ